MTATTLLLLVVMLKKFPGGLDTMTQLRKALLFFFTFVTLGVSSLEVVAQQADPETAKRLAQLETAAAAAQSGADNAWLLVCAECDGDCALGVLRLQHRLLRRNALLRKLQLSFSTWCWSGC